MACAAVIKVGTINYLQSNRQRGSASKSLDPIGSLIVGSRINNQNFIQGTRLSLELRQQALDVFPGVQRRNNEGNLLVLHYCPLNMALKVRAKTRTSRERLW